MKIGYFQHNFGKHIFWKDFYITWYTVGEGAATSEVKDGITNSKDEAATSRPKEKDNPIYDYDSIFSARTKRKKFLNMMEDSVSFYYVR